MMKALILVRGDQKENAFGRYTGEILRVEGLNWYQIEELGAQDADYLNRFELVILTHCFVRQAEIQTLLDYVEQGGRLVSFRPCLRLGQALGLEATHRAQKGGYLRIDGRHPLGKGLCDQSIQFHGMAEHWDLAEDSALTVVARLGQARDAISERPGFVVGPVGSGRVALFAYDLPAAVASIRQGDPALANALSSGKDGTYRPSEHFTGHLDETCASIPQADVHTGLLVRAIDWLMGHPMPRLWYYARAFQRSVLIVTSDDDWSKVSEFEALMAAVEKRGGHITFYVVPGTKINKELVVEWEKRGHVFSVHPDFRSLVEPPANLSGYGMDEQYFLLTEMLRSSVQNHKEQFDRPANTIRQHALRWRGYVDAAQTMEELGVQMDLNYYSIMPYAASYMTGSGRPMKFVDEWGKIINVFQQATVYSEDTTIGSHSFSPNWSTEEALARVAQMLSVNVERYYTPIVLNAHPVSFATYSGEFVEGILDLAMEHGMPILSADEWLDFTLARYEAEFVDLKWQDATLHFTLCTKTQPAELTILWPLGGREIDRVTVDGKEQAAIVRSLWGEQFALLNLVASRQEHIVQVDFVP